MGMWQKPGDRLRLIVMGQQAFGKDALQKILDTGKDEVAAVYCAPDRAGAPVDPLKALAAENGIPVHQPGDFSDDAVIAQMRAHDADVMIMAFVTAFVPQAARDAAAMGSICFHPSLLPLHRGPSAVNWPIILGATQSGFSWFYPTDGLDEGDVLMQWRCAIAPDDTVIDLYFKKIYPAAISSVSEVCDMFRSGAPGRYPQDHAKATYESRCKTSDACIDWSKPVGDVYNLIRGTNPSPGAWTTLNGKEIQIYNCRRRDGGGSPGEVTAVCEDTITVQAAGGRIEIMRVRPGGGDKIPAGQWAAGIGLAVGARLGV